MRFKTHFSCKKDKNPTKTEFEHLLNGAQYTQIFKLLSLRIKSLQKEDIMTENTIFTRYFHLDELQTRLFIVIHLFLRFSQGIDVFFLFRLVSNFPPQCSELFM